MGRIIFNLAMSIDGYIADEKGGFDWIKGHDDRRLDTPEKFDFETFMESIGIIVMGSKAYEDCPEESLKSWSDKRIMVATSRALDGGPNIEFVNSDICEKVLALQKESDKDIWIFGGGILADAFIKADIIDTYIVGIIPVILGKGRPLFRGDNPLLELHLEEVVIDDGITILRYKRRSL